MLKLIFTTISVLLISVGALGAEKINTLGESSGFFSSPKPTGVAIKGYDSVAYFTENKAVKGKKEFSFKWNGAVWYFSSQENLEAFKGNTAKYAPQYGGYCAYGVSKGYLVKIEPDQFTVLNGKLYLNYDSSVQKKWEVKKEKFIKLADEKISELYSK